MTSEFIQNITALYFIATQSFVSTNKPPSKKIVLHSFMPRRKIRRGRSVVAPSEQVIQGNVKIFADGQQHAHGRLLFVAFPAVYGIAAYAEYCPELLLRKSPCEPKLPQSISESFHTQTIHENRDLLLEIMKIMIKACAAQRKKITVFSRRIIFLSRLPPAQKAARRAESKIFLIQSKKRVDKDGGSLYNSHRKN